VDSSPEGGLSSENLRVKNGQKLSLRGPCLQQEERIFRGKSEERGRYVTKRKDKPHRKKKNKKTKDTKQILRDLTEGTGGRRWGRCEPPKKRGGSRATSKGVVLGREKGGNIQKKKRTVEDGPSWLAHRRGKKEGTQIRKKNYRIFRERK